jgi:hypothetical protein
VKKPNPFAAFADRQTTPDMASRNDKLLARAIHDLAEAARAVVTDATKGALVHPNLIATLDGALKRFDDLQRHS